MTYAALLLAGVATLWLLLRRRPDPIAVDELGCVDITGQAIEEFDDMELPGMWSHSDWSGGVDEVRP